MRVACLQLNPQDVFEENIKNALTQIHLAKDQCAEVIVLPEMFTFMGRESERGKTSSALDSGIFLKLKSLAAELEIAIVAGSHSETSPNKERSFNTSLAIDKTGEVLSVYRKIHLFNLMDKDGLPLYCESDVFLPGESVSEFDFACDGQNWHCCLAICYDLRFPEIFRTKSTKSNPYDVIFLPAAFTHQTGEAHWEILLRARAIENQCYVVACDQTGYFAEGKKRNFGHSMIVDPWGNKIAAAADGVENIFATLEKSAIQNARTRLPALANRVL